MEEWQHGLEEQSAVHYLFCLQEPGVHQVSQETEFLLSMMGLTLCALNFFPFSHPGSKTSRQIPSPACTLFLPLWNPKEVYSSWDPLCRDPDLEPQQGNWEFPRGENSQTVSRGKTAWCWESWSDGPTPLLPQDTLALTRHNTTGQNSFHGQNMQKISSAIKLESFQCIVW